MQIIKQEGAKHVLLLALDATDLMLQIAQFVMHSTFIFLQKTHAL